MLKTYKYRLYPTRKQTEKLDRTLETCRVLYNSCLIDRKQALRTDRQRIIPHRPAKDISSR
ncbi:MAG: helix-turn-helix domain-containing protein [Deltaproteobacteria bacterium]|nr:helix-turn-helix domain-containing protein [Deltaproteobacteria bacterium]MCL5891577.1 helix-turn-helix domain-containing protein [Deltaproteobacteria bacterium]